MSRIATQEIITALARLSSNYRQPLNETDMDTYVRTLLPYGSAAIASAVDTILGDPDAPGWFPRTQEIIVRITGSRKRQLALAWNKFRTGISTHSGMTVAFDDPLIHFAAKSLGGWTRLGMMNTYALDNLRADFCELYSAAVEEPPPVKEIPRRLVGDDHAPEGKAITIGDREKAIAVARGDIASALMAVTFKPNAGALAIR